MLRFEPKPGKGGSGVSRVGEGEQLQGEEVSQRKEPPPSLPAHTSGTGTRRPTSWSCPYQHLTAQTHSGFAWAAEMLFRVLRHLALPDLGGVDGAFPSPPPFWELLFPTVCRKETLNQSLACSLAWMVPSLCPLALGSV